jgi:hypothetical protein
VVGDESSALGEEGRHVAPLLARAAGVACVLATQGLADLARVDRALPQQVAQNSAVRVLPRQASADDALAWARHPGQYEREERSRRPEATWPCSGRSPRGKGDAAAVGLAGPHGRPPLPGLRAALRRAARTQEQLAERAAVGVSTVAHLEAATRPAAVATARKLAAALGVGPEALTAPAAAE